MTVSSVLHQTQSRKWAWIVIAAMLLSAFLIFGNTGKALADEDAEAAKYTVTIDLQNGDEPIILPVEEGQSAYDAALAIAKQQDPSVTEVPDPDWGSCHKFKGWTLYDEPYDLKTPVTKNIMIKATWELLNNGWEIDPNVFPMFEGVLTDNGIKFDHITVIEQDEYSLWISFVSPADIERDAYVISLDGGKTWEAFSKYTDENPRENPGDAGRYDAHVPFRADLSEIESHLEDKSALTWDVWFAKKDDTENPQAKFLVEVYPEKFAIENNEGRKTYIIEDWTVTVREIEIVYAGNGGINEQDEGLVSCIHNALDPMILLKCPFEKEEYQFVAWSTGKENLGHLYRADHELPGNLFAENVSFYAQWAKEDMWIVNFETEGGSDVDAQMVKLNGTVVKPEDPKKEGFEFKYWTLDTNDKEERKAFSFKTKLKEDTVLFAVWEEAAEPTYEFGDFMERLYSVAFNRESDAEGKEFWVEQVKTDAYTGGGCALYFLTSPEFLQKKTTDDEFLKTVYKTFFDREPEKEGFAFWQKFLKEGHERADVVKSFVDSKEWCNLCAKYGIKSGAPTAKAEIPSVSAKGFAERMYTKCLGREAEAEGLEYWSLALTNLEKDGAGCAKFFFESDEFVNFKTDNKEYVTRLYRTFMNREPEADGLKYWVGQLDQGEARENVLRGFVDSKEFTEICLSYGIEKGTL
ncbi:MAG: DUF4214 domain-containing protein [Clostridiales bacterium]|nr:DUF4214 domain-containing protein [Clostridiales bacterium]